MIVVTGGAGFIGSALIERLSTEGIDDIVIVDALGRDAKWKNLAKAKFRSIVHIDQFFSWLESSPESRATKVIFHLGACSSTTEKDLDFLLSNNLNFSKDLITHCARREIAVVYASSAATYGMGELGFSDEESTTKQLRPINPYGWSKQLVDLWMLHKETVKPQNWFGLKFFNVFGPNEYHKEHMQSLIAKSYAKVLVEKKLGLFKSYKDGVAHGHQKRDFIYIKDAVDVMLHIFKNYNSLDSGIYNVGTGVPRTFADLGLSLFKALDIPPAIAWIDMPDNLQAQYQYYTASDTHRLRNKLNYKKEFTTLESAVTDYVSYLSSEDQYL